MKGFTDEPESLLAGFGKLEKVRIYLPVRRCYAGAGSALNVVVVVVWTESLRRGPCVDISGSPPQNFTMTDGKL